MNPNNLTISLIERVDSKGDTYYIGSANYEFPVLVDLSKIDFLVFHPPEKQDEEERSYASLVIRNGTRRDRG